MKLLAVFIALLAVIASAMQARAEDKPPYDTFLSPGAIICVSADALHYQRQGEGAGCFMFPNSRPVTVVEKISGSNKGAAEDCHVRGFGFTKHDSDDFWLDCTQLQSSLAPSSLPGEYDAPPIPANPLARPIFLRAGAVFCNTAEEIRRNKKSPEEACKNTKQSWPAYVILTAQNPSTGPYYECQVRVFARQDYTDVWIDCDDLQKSP